MKRILLTFLLTLPPLVWAQEPIQGSTTPTVMSVGELMRNYNLDSSWVNDTANMVRYLESQPQNYVELTNLCVSLRQRVNRAINSIEHDYDFRDSLIWLDSNTVLGDYAIYEQRLRELDEFLDHKSHQYKRLEQERIEAAREAARLAEIEAARQRQLQLNRQAEALRTSIREHDRAIMQMCDGVGVTDKKKLEWLGMLSHCYIPVYNMFDLSEGNATEESIARLEQLNDFQNDLLENLLGENSLPNQIDNFKNILKQRCEKDNGDIYRSYSKVFKSVKVPVTFTNIREYEEYLGRLRAVIGVQQTYLQTIELRAAIARGTEAIASTYGKKYRDIVGAYREALKTVNQLPAYTLPAESVVFIGRLQDFIAAQQIYLDFYPIVEGITQRGDSILSHREYPDVVTAYRNAQPALQPLPGFNNPDGATVYENQLNQVIAVQQCYLDVLAMRETITENDELLLASKKVDKVLSKGYGILRKQVDLRPAFSTIERGRSCIDLLQGYIEMQELALETMRKTEMIKDNEKLINDRNLPYPNIRKAYALMYKNYYGLKEINNTEDLRRYSRQNDYIIEMQQAFIRTLHSGDASMVDARLKREKSIETIKLSIGLL